MYHLVANCCALPTKQELLRYSHRYITSHDKEIILKCAVMALQGQHPDNYAFIIEGIYNIVTIHRLGTIKKLRGEPKLNQFFISQTISLLFWNRLYEKH